ncbi:hypothetical protein, partial [Saccharococcus thermophilus]|uniref:hypothetical protein n=1 Tax=Saccharococcus thermophilus TaxID=29396 RepID=UPI00360FD825
GRFGLAVAATASSRALQRLPGLISRLRFSMWTLRFVQFSRNISLSKQLLNNNTAFFYCQPCFL